MKKLLLFLGGVAGLTFTYAQSLSPQVIASSGTTFSSASSKLEFTIGEVVTTTLTTSGNTLTQGFHQPKVLFAISAIDNKGEKISVYPNPVVDHVLVDFSGAEGNHLVEIFDMRGQLLKRELVVDKQKQIKISFLEYANGIYLINVIDKDSNSHSSYKINKSE